MPVRFMGFDGNLFFLVARNKKRRKRLLPFERTEYSLLETKY
jgi:hypothetical protein